MKCGRNKTVNDRLTEQWAEVENTLLPVRYSNIWYIITFFHVVNSKREVEQQADSAERKVCTVIWIHKRLLFGQTFPLWVNFCREVNLNQSGAGSGGSFNGTITFLLEQEPCQSDIWTIVTAIKTTVISLPSTTPTNLMKRTRTSQMCFNGYNTDKKPDSVCKSNGANF